VAAALFVVAAILCLTVDPGLGTRRPHGTSHGIIPALFKTLTTGVLTDGGIGTAHFDITSAAVHGIIVNAVLRGTN
jgi:hypothetical protein